MSSLGKVVVVGPGEAGKSTLIRLVTERSLNLEVRGRTVAMDHGLLTRGADSLSLVGLPGQDRFRPVQETLIAGARGAVWVHPAGLPPAPGTEELVLLMAAARVPYLVYVNRRDGEPLSGWCRPPRLPPERAVLEGNLLAAGPGLEELKEALWALVEN